MPLMKKSGKKRARSDADETRAECPFSVRQRAPTAAELAKQNTSEDDRKSQWHWQTSPFHPAGFIKANQSMDVKYAIDPAAQWNSMTKYNSFILGKEKFHTDTYVFVANEDSVKRQKTKPGDVNGSGAADNLRPNNDWVARILEIKALDQQHVYARVNWMYWPDELPAGTQIGRKTIRGGRQPYHGRHELIASNHMDVINAVSVTMAAEVNHWVETDEEDTQPALYWRQAYNCNTSQLSAAKDICKCETPAHPDKILIRCSSSECGRWMHDDCLSHDALTRVYERLGRSRPQVFDENGDMESTVEVKKEDTPAEKNGTDNGEEEHVLNGVKLPFFTGSPPNLDKGTPVAAAKKGAKKQPYKGLFEATIRLNDGATAFQIQDLRPNITGGTRLWNEQPYCLFCASAID